MFVALLRFVREPLFIGTVSYKVNITTWKEFMHKERDMRNYVITVASILQKQKKKNISYDLLCRFRKSFAAGFIILQDERETPAEVQEMQKNRLKLPICIEYSSKQIICVHSPLAPAAPIIAIRKFFASFTCKACIFTFTYDMCNIYTKIRYQIHQYYIQMCCFPFANGYYCEYYAATEIQSKCNPIRLLFACQPTTPLR